MAHLVIEDVRKGMDTRRSSLASPDGTLTEGLDGHITPGGNFEKRKAFTKLTLPAGSFGLQPVPTGLLVFGSGADPGGWPNDADGNAVTYQRLQHPAVLLGESYSAGSHAMTAVVFSDVYGGQAFVIAEFADGKRYCYYNGSLVRDFTDGLVLAGRTTTAEIAADFEATVDRTDNYTATTAGSIVSVTGPAGSEYLASVMDQSALGTLTGSKTSAPTNPLAGNKATGSFRITGGNGTPAVTFATTNRARTSNVATLTIGTHSLVVGTKVNVAGLGGSGYNASDLVLTAVGATTISYANTGGDEGTTADVGGTVTVQNQIVKVQVSSTTITSAAVNWATSNEVTAALLAANITAYAATGGYTAEANGALITVTATAEDDAPNNSELKITAAGNVCCGEGVFQFSDPLNTGMTVTEIKIDGYASDLLTSASLVFPGTYTTITALVAQIAAEINTNTATHGFVACGTGGRLSISKAVTSSNDPDLAVSINYTGGAIIQVPSDAGVILPVLVTIRAGNWSQVSATYWSVELRTEVTGGVPPYSYEWGEVFLKSYDGFVYQGRTSAVAYCYVLSPATTTPDPTTQVYCRVRDSGQGNTQQVATSNTLRFKL